MREPTDYGNSPDTPPDAAWRMRCQNDFNRERAILGWVCGVARTDGATVRAAQQELVEAGRDVVTDMRLDVLRAA